MLRWQKIGMAGPSWWLTEITIFYNIIVEEHHNPVARIAAMDAAGLLRVG